MGESLITESFTGKALNRNPILDSIRIQKQQGQMNSSFEKLNIHGEGRYKYGVRKKGEIHRELFGTIARLLFQIFILKSG